MNPPVKIFFRLSPDEEGWPPVSVESVWATPTDVGNEYVIANIPFFALEANEDDRVRVCEEDGVMWMDSLVQSGGASLLRVVFYDATIREQLVAELKQLKSASEYLEQYNILSISVPSYASLGSVQRLLSRYAALDLLDYEEALLRESSAT
jgi:hypothetical protein